MIISPHRKERNTFINPVVSYTGSRHDYTVGSQLPAPYLTQFPVEYRQAMSNVQLGVQQLSGGKGGDIRENAAVFSPGLFPGGTMPQFEQMNTAQQTAALHEPLHVYQRMRPGNEMVQYLRAYGRIDRRPFGAAREFWGGYVDYMSGSWGGPIPNKNNIRGVTAYFGGLLGGWDELTATRMQNWPVWGYGDVRGQALQKAGIVSPDYVEQVERRGREIEAKRVESFDRANLNQLAQQNARKAVADYQARFRRTRTPTAGGGSFAV